MRNWLKTYGANKSNQSIVAPHHLVHTKGAKQKTRVPGSRLERLSGCLRTEETMPTFHYLNNERLIEWHSLEPGRIQRQNCLAETGLDGRCDIENVAVLRSISSRDRVIVTQIAHFWTILEVERLIT